MFQFRAKFLKKPTPTTIMPDVPTGDAAKTTTNHNHLTSRPLQERQRRAMVGTSSHSGGSAVSTEQLFVFTKV